MSTRKSRSDEELVAALHAARAKDALEEELAKSDEEVARAIDAAGGDARAIGERGAREAGALHARRAAMGAPPKDVHRLHVRTVVVLAAALAACATATYVERARIAHLFAPHAEVVEPPPSPAALASGLRDQAVKACHERRWDDCEDLLGRAYDLDPAGEGEPRVVRARWAINEARQHGPQFPWFDKEHVGPPRGGGARREGGAPGDKPTVPPR